MAVRMVQCRDLREELLHCGSTGPCALNSAFQQQGDEIRKADDILRRVLALDLPGEPPAGSRNQGAIGLILDKVGSTLKIGHSCCQFTLVTWEKCTRRRDNVRPCLGRETKP